MAWSSSYLASATFRDVLNGAATYKMGPASSPTTSYLALFSNSVTPNINQDGGVGTGQQYNSTPWNANEIYGTGWAQGGVALSTPSLVLDSSVGIQFGAANVTQTGTTLAATYGCIVYASSTNFVMAAVYFGGGFSTTSGTFSISWPLVNSLPCIWYVNLT